MGRKHGVTKIMAIILGVTMLVTALPLDILAADGDSANGKGKTGIEITREESEVTIGKDAGEATNPYILAEVEGERSETTKTFRMSDGSYMLVTYDQPVHYER